MISWACFRVHKEPWGSFQENITQWSLHACLQSKNIFFTIIAIESGIWIDLTENYSVSVNQLYPVLFLVVINGSVLYRKASQVQSCGLWLLDRVKSSWHLDQLIYWSVWDANNIWHGLIHSVDLFSLYRHRQNREHRFFRLDLPLSVLSASPPYLTI